MSWSVSASGKRADVKAQIDRQVNPHPNATTWTADQIEEFVRANLACQQLVDSTRGSDTHVSISAHGSYDGGSVIVKSWKEEVPA